MNVMCHKVIYQIDDLTLLHLRLGHYSYDKLKHVCKLGYDHGLKINDSDFTMYKPVCPVCAKSKMQRPHAPRTHRQVSTRIGDLIFSDIHGPVNVESSGGYRYMIHFTDDYSRFTKLYFLKTRSGTEITEKFKDYCN